MVVGALLYLLLHEDLLREQLFLQLLVLNRGDCLGRACCCARVILNIL